MSRASVRTAIAAYFGGTLVPGTAGTYRGGTIPALGTLYLAKPKRFPATDFTAGQASGAQSGAMAVVLLPRQRETRRTFGRGVGIKRVAYDASLDVYHLSTARDAIAAQNDFDALLEAVETRLRADPTLGGAVFSAGEGDLSNLTGEPGFLEWEVGNSDNSGERTETWARLTFTVVEHQTG